MCATERDPARVALLFERFPAGAFRRLVREGFKARVKAGASIRDVLCRDLGLDDAALERVSTVFLQGEPVDDISRARLGEGSRLSLSGAMPGLAGAVLRRGGYYGAMRGSITHEAGRAFQRGDVTIEIRLFNMLMDELGPVFLARGILLPKESFLRFVRDQDGAFWRACLRITLNGQPATLEDLCSAASFANRDMVELTASGE